jgi:hypothetical protein
MFKSKLIITLVCAAALAGCATGPMTVAQKDPQVDLYAFKTFGFFGPSAGQRSRGTYGTLAGEQLKAATVAQMERLGYVYDERDPDLRINIALSVRQRAEVRSAPGSGPLPHRAWGSVETVDYREGTLAIDVVDAHRRTMVWRGVTQDRISRKDMEKADETLRDAVQEVFAKYPRKA